MLRNRVTLPDVASFLDGSLNIQVKHNCSYIALYRIGKKKNTLKSGRANFLVLLSITNGV